MALITARKLRSVTPTPRYTREECVRRCGVCAESTPYVRVVRERSLLLIMALAFGVSSLWMETWIAASAGLAAFAFWVFLRRRDFARPLQCVRCLDRPWREGGTYLIDFFF